MEDLTHLALAVKLFERGWVETLELRRLTSDTLTETQLQEAVVAMRGQKGEGQAAIEWTWYEALQRNGSLARAKELSATKRAALDRIFNPDQMRLLYEAGSYDTAEYWRGRIRER